MNAPIGAGGGSVPYQGTILIASWVLNGATYELLIPESSHGKGAIIAVQVFELSGGVYSEVEVDIRISASGDITLIIQSSPDLRFDGKLIVIGE